MGIGPSVRTTNSTASPLRNSAEMKLLRRGGSNRVARIWTSSTVGSEKSTRCLSGIRSPASLLIAVSFRYASRLDDLEVVERGRTLVWPVARDEDRHRFRKRKPGL